MSERKQSKAKSYLQQIGRIDSRIDAKLAECSRLRMRATSITQTIKIDIVSGGGGPGDKLGETVAKIVDLEKEIDRDIDSFVDLKREIAGMLEKVEPELHYTVLHKRYMLGLTWQQIADEIGYTMRGVQKIHGRALQTFSRVMDETVQE